MLIDITRLADRYLQGRLPTGVDRVSLAYLRHYRENAGALIRFAGRWLELGSSDSQRIFSFLLDGSDLSGRGVIRRSVAKALVWPGHSRQRSRALFNTGHSGLDDPVYAQQVSRRGLKPIFFLHDLIPISHPEYSRPGEDFKHHQRMKTMLSVGKGLVVNSQDTLNQLNAYAAQRHLAVPPSVVAWLAPTKFVHPLVERPLAKPYFVVLGTIEARKNHILLLHIWRQMVATMGEAAPQLVIIGQRGWECEHVFDMLERCTALRGHVLELSGCSDQEVATWLKHAQALLFPSFVEGYGIPLVEALMLGVPVIASDLPVFHEIAGDIPHYLDPTDGPGWRQTILDYADSSSAARQSQLDLLAAYSPPTWEQHFAVVDALVREIDAGN